MPGLSDPVCDGHSPSSSQLLRLQKLFKHTCLLGSQRSMDGFAKVAGDQQRPERSTGCFCTFAFVGLYKKTSLVHEGLLSQQKQLPQDSNVGTCTFSRSIVAHLSWDSIRPDRLVARHTRLKASSKSTKVGICRTSVMISVGCIATIEEIQSSRSSAFDCLCPPSILAKKVIQASKASVGERHSTLSLL